MHAKLDIRVGQVWRTRGAGSVRVTTDRQEFAVLPEWRWALSSGYIANDAGRVSARGWDDKHDLIALLEEGKK